jgi:uncharacterized membrane protein YkvA (DUF1232 family)
MLKAFQYQLEAMAEDREGKFSEQIKKRMPKELPKSLEKEMKAFILMLPKIERRIFELYVWLPETSKVKEIGSHFLAYMYQPDDFIPECESNGLFGYMDDAYIAALFYELMIEEIENSQAYRLSKEDKELLRRLIQLRKKAQVIIPEESEKIREMIGELFEGNERIFQELFQKNISK